MQGGIGGKERSPPYDLCPVEALAVLVSLCMRGGKSYEWKGLAISVFLCDFAIAPPSRIPGRESSFPLFRIPRLAMPLFFGA